MDLEQMRQRLQQETQQQQRIDPIKYYWEEYISNKKLSGSFWRFYNKKMTFAQYLEHKTMAEQLAIQEETKNALIGILDIVNKDYNKKYGKPKPIVVEDDDEDEEVEDDEEEEKVRPIKAKKR